MLLKFAGKFRGTVLASQIGYNVLKAGGSAIDAVEAAVRSMEVDPDFNAGYGSVLNSDGEVNFIKVLNYRILKIILKG